MATYLIWARGQSWRDIPYPSSHMPEYWSGRPESARPTRTDADWHTYQVWATAFYSTPRAIELAEATMRFVLGRVNSKTGVAYRDDPTILAYELCNEPRAVVGETTERPAARQAYLRWVERSAVGCIRSRHRTPPLPVCPKLRLSRKSLPPPLSRPPPHQPPYSASPYPLRPLSDATRIWSSSSLRVTWSPSVAKAPRPSRPTPTTTSTALTPSRASIW